MNTELINIIITAAVTLVSGGGVAAVAAVMYRKQTRRLKDAEASAAELKNKLDAVDLKDRERQYNDNRIDDLHEALDKMNKHLNDLTQSNTEKDNTIDDKVQQIRRINEENAALLKQLADKETYIGRLKLFVQWLAHWHCKRETGAKKGQCGRRLPAQDVPTPFREYPDKELVAELGGVNSEPETEQEGAADADEND
ncbi:MAG: hypothetical protein J6C59_09340 [Muribaculaceae bacterium]|nr:hypothetical protein [Muribaculaceae bacterium]